ncbi:hypothetical protein BC832DRAFT_426258 [Gaertneriomyces semiglobifer]|nr:hypothetical protein BC832DRAFT_426258 [Gaertneriomyces semiglobifer]
MYATAQRGTLAAVHPYTYDEERIRNELGTDQQPLPQYSYDELQAEQHQLRLPGQHEESIQQHQHFEGTTLTRGSTHARYPDRMLPPIQTLAPALQHQGSTQHTPQHQRRISSLSGQQPLQAYGAYQPQALAANYAVPQAGHLQYPSQQQHSYSTLRQIPQQRYDSLESSHSLLAPPPQQPQPQPHPHPHPQQQSAMVLPPPQLQQLTVNGLVAQSQHAAPLISNYLSHQQTRQMQQLNRTAHPAVQAAAAQAVAVAAANGFAVPLNYLNIANPSPSFAHFTANITQMPNQFYYQPVMYHQPGPLPIHPLAYQSALAAAYNTGMGSSVVPVNAAAAVAAAASASSVPFAPPLAASGARSQEWYEQALQVAHEKYNHGEYTTAYNMLLALYQTNQSHLPTLLLLGCTCYSLNLYQLSIQYNNLILQLDPNFAEAYSNLGTTYRAMAQNAHALQHVGGVSGTGTSAYNLSMAEQYYRMAISIRPKYWDASINLAGLQSANARYSEAIQVYANYERVMEEEYETNERFDLVALGQTESSGSGNKNDADFVTVLTSIEKQRKTRAIAEKASGRSVRGESSGWTDGRRRDLYYAKASLMYANGDVAGAKQEYLKGLVAIGLDLQPIYAQARTGSLPSSAVTPQQALVGLQQQQSLKGLKSNLDYNSTASAILQTMAKIYQDAHQMPLSVSFYYLALSICPNANTCNNIGILLSQHRLHEAIA